MFLEKLRREDPGLIEAVCRLEQEGAFLPDSYVVDVDQFRKNAAVIKKTADEAGVRLFFMLKQLGRNPYLARVLTDLGYEGAVVVDFKEAQVMMRNGIPISHVGNLVQTPSRMIPEMVAYGPEYMTVFSADKAEEISRAAADCGRVQKILIRVYGEGDVVYSGQTAGIDINDLAEFVRTVKEFPGVRIAGVTSFPCFLYSDEAAELAPTPNMTTVLRAADILRDEGIEPELINTPSATCVQTIRMMGQMGSNSGEPGHGLTGTTPAHAVYDLPEKTCVAYVSEISHNFGGKAYCYGGGYYRRSHMENALVGSDPADLRGLKVTPPDMSSIDYYFELGEPCSVGETVIMAFRYQIFVTRSDVVLLEGISEGEPRIVGIYDSLGNLKEDI